MWEHRIFFKIAVRHAIVTLGMFPERLTAAQTPTWVGLGAVEADTDGFGALVAGMRWTLGGDLDLPVRLLWASTSFP